MSRSSNKRYKKKMWRLFELDEPVLVTHKVPGQYEIKLVNTPTRTYSWQDRHSKFVPYVPRSYVTKDRVFLYSQNHGWFWNRVSRKPNGELKNRLYEEGRRNGFSSDYLFHWFAKGDVGGEFTLTKESTTPIHTTHVNEPKYKGTMILVRGFTGDVPSLPSVAATPRSKFNELGTLAISQVIPNKPHANVAAFLGELREGLPTLPGRSYRNDPGHSLSNTGGEYLNLQFGIIPTASDITEICNAIKNSREIFEQFLRDAGKKVRRGFQFPVETSTVLYPNVRVDTGCGVTGYNLMRGDVSDEIVTKRWFSGAFRYDVPNGNSALDTLKRYEAQANNLLGLRLTPELIWQLAPWSWMIDWFSNVGNLVTNVTLLGSDGMEMQYGYMMEERMVRRTVTSSFNGKPLKTEISFSSKRRIRATPYGFGVDFSSLSDYQMSILVALGLSQGRRR